MVASVDDADLTDEVGDASNVFLLAPTFTPGVETWCSDLLVRASGESGATLYVGNRSPNSYIEKLQRHASSALPREIVFLTLGETKRSPSNEGGVATEHDDIDVVVRSVESPGNLTKIGVELNDVLTGWASTEAKVSICFESLTPLIQYSDVEKVYRFLHVLTNQVKSVDAKAHYHLDPGAHDQTDVNLLLTMVDAVVEPADDGGVRIRQR